VPDRTAAAPVERGLLGEERRKLLGLSPPRAARRPSRSGVADGGAAAKAIDDTIKGIKAAVIASTTAALAGWAATAGNS
jgi:hypothetical protein